MPRQVNPTKPSAIKHERRSAWWGTLPFADSQPAANDDVDGPWREDVIELLDDSLQTEMVCVLRYRRHASQTPFSTEALAEAMDADQIADRIVDRITDRMLHTDADEVSARVEGAPTDDVDDFRATRQAEPLRALQSTGAQRHAGAYLDDRDPPLRQLREDSLRAGDRADPDDWLAR